MGLRLPGRVIAWLGGVALLAALLPAAATAAGGPAIVGAVSDPTNLSGTVSVAVSGNYAYTTAYHSGELTAVDFSNPANPVIAGESAPFLDANLIGGSNVAIAGGYAFVVSKNRNASTSGNDDGNGNSLTILDIHTNPAQPAIVGTIRDTGKLFGTYGVAVSGNYAYVAYQGVLLGQPTGPDTSSGGFSVIDISNPGSPTIVANIDNGSLPVPFTGSNALQHATSVGISGGYAYVTAFYSDRVTVINIATPTAPKIVASLRDTTNLGNPADLAVQGNDVYVADQIGGTVPQFTVVDVSKPTAPKVVGTLINSAALGGAYRIRVRGNFAYIAASGAKAIVAIDISNPLQPRLAASVQSTSDLNRTTGLDVTSDGRYVVASSPYLSSQFNATYPPYPLQSGGGPNTGTISVIQLDPNPIAATISAASEPPNPTASTSANFTFSASDTVSTVQCQLDGAAFAPCTSATSQSYSGLALGSHTFTVQATDAAGNASSSSYTWTVGAAPANTTLPTISGSAVQGQTLTANPGTWSGYPPPTYAYQWEQCDSTGANCNPIQGATSQTYTVQPGDVNNTLSVSVLATNSLGSAAAASGASSQILAAPASSAAPSITGTALVGSQLTASPGTWSGFPAPSYTYQWQSCDQQGQHCNPIAGATGSTYTLVAGDAGTTLVVAVTATNSVGSTAASSQATQIVDEVSQNTASPSVSGSAAPGQVLTASPGSWAGYPAPSYSYQWAQCDSNGQNCQALTGDTNQTYTVATTDLGMTLSVTVTATNIAGTGSASSSATAVVSSAPVSTGAPAVRGTAIVGDVLTAGTGTWTAYPAPSYTYQWQSCDQNAQNCTPISGATSSTYTLGPGDAATTLEVVVTATNGLGSGAATSGPTAVVGQVPANTSAPAISGSVVQGQTLTANPGAWSGYPAPTYSYQWQQCDPNGQNCQPIMGANTQSYVPQSGDVGQTLAVIVTATNSAGQAAATAGPTGTVAPGPTAPSNQTAPVVSGSATVGGQLTATPGAWTGTAPISYAYQWQRCNGSSCASTGGTSSSYTPVAADAGLTLEVIVTATNTVGSSNATSNATAAVTQSPQNTAAPGISGSAVQGQTLTASTGTWQGYPAPTYAYQWQRCNQSGGSCVNINANGAGSAYVLSRADMASTVRVMVTASNGIGSAASAPSAVSAIVAGKPQNVTLPAVSGTATQGNTLTGTSGTWTGYPTPTYTYQWNRCTGATGACTPIAGATTTTYTVTAADVGFTLRIYVVATNSAGAIGARSNPTGSIQAGTLTAGIVGSPNAAPSLHVAVAVRPDQPAVARVALHAPAGITFAALQKAARGLTVRGENGRKIAFTATLRDGTLTLILRRAATRFTVEITGPELVVTHAVIDRLNRDPKASGRLTVLASSAAASPALRTLSLRLR